MVIPTVGEGSEVDKVGWPTLMGRGLVGARLRVRGSRSVGARLRGMGNRVGHPTLLTSDPSPTVGNNIIHQKNKICKV